MTIEITNEPINIIKKEDDDDRIKRQREEGIVIPPSKDLPDYNVRTVEGLSDEDLVEYDKDPIAFEKKELNEGRKPQSKDDDEIDNIIDNMSEEEGASLQISLNKATEENNSQQSEVLNLSNKLKVSPEFVKRNLDFSRTEVKRRQIDKSKLTEEYPSLSKYLSEPENALLSVNDIDALSEVEKNARQLKDNLTKRGDLLQIKEALISGKPVGELELEGESLGALTMGAVSLAEQAAGLPDLALGGTHSLLENTLGKEYSDVILPYLKREEGNYLDAFKSALSDRVGALRPKAMEASISNSIKEGNYAQAINSAYLHVISQGPQLAGMFGLAAVGKAKAALRFLSSLSAASAFQAAQKEGQSVDTSLLRAFIHGAAEYGFEKYTMGALGKLKDAFIKIGVTDSVAVKEGVKTFLKEFTKGASLEGGTEGMTTATQKVADYLTGKEDGLENIVVETIDSSIVGVIIGGGMSTVAEVGHAFQRKEYSSESDKAMDELLDEQLNAHQSLNEVEKLKKLGEAIESLDETKEVPGQIEKIVEDIYEGDEGSVYFQKDEWLTYWDKKGEDVDEVSQSISESVQKDYESTESGLIEIPIAKFAENFGNTKEYEELLEIVKTKADGLNSKEAKDAIKKIAVAMEAIDKEIQETEKEDSPLGSIRKSMKEEWVKSGLPLDQINSIVTTSMHRLKKRAHDLNRPIEDVYEESKFTVNRINTPEDLAEQRVNTSKKTYFQDKEAPSDRGLGFYSKLENLVLEKMKFKKAPAKNVLDQIQKAEGISKEERDFIGIDEYLEGMGDQKISRDDLLNLIREKNIVISQEVLGDIAGEKNLAAEGEWSEVESVGFDYDSAWESANEDEYFQEGGEYYEEERGKIEEKARKEYKENFFKDVEKEIRDEVIDENREDEDFDIADYEDEIRERSEDKFNDEYGDNIYSDVESELLDWRDGELEKIVEDMKGDPDSYYSYHTFATTIYTPDGDFRLEAYGGEDSGSEWWSPDTGEHYSSSLNEAKIEFINDLISRGDITSNPAQFIDIENVDVEFKHPTSYFSRETNLENIEKIKKENEEYLKIVEDHYKEYKEDEFWTENYTDEKLREMSVRNSERDAQRIYKEKLLAGEYGELKLNGNVQPYEDVTITKVIHEDGSISYEGGRGEWDGEEFEFTVEAKNDADLLVEMRELVTQNNMVKIDSESEPETPKGLIEETTEEPPNKPTSRAQWKSHTVDGSMSEDYREFLITIPNSEANFQETIHFDSKFSNYILHARTTIKEQDGKKILYLEELQSDWHQTGREFGYEDAELAIRKKEIQAEMEAEVEHRIEIESRIARKYGYDELLKGDMDPENYDLAWEEAKNLPSYIESKARTEYLKEELSATLKAAPDAPFKKTNTWVQMALKRLIAIANEEGLDAVALSPGWIHSHRRRWGTDQFVWKTEDGKFFVDTRLQEGGTVIDANGNETSIEEMYRNNPESLAENGLQFEVNGEEISTFEELHKLVKSNSYKKGPRSIRSTAEQIWEDMQAHPSGFREPRAEGFKLFYDISIPSQLKEVLKKLDKKIKIEKKVFKTEDYGEVESVYFELTDKAREKLPSTLTLFQHRRGQVRIGDKSINIDLFKDMNFSTILHEAFGHLWLHEVGIDYDYLMSLPEDKLTTDQKNYMKLAEDILGYVGAESFDEITVDQHEKFADSAEKYFMEGKSPERSLKPIFEKFKTWMIAIYQEIKNIRGDALSKEARDVFDRMLMSEKSVSEAMIQALYDDEFLIGMNESDRSNYKKIISESEEEAEKQMLDELMKGHRKKNEKSYKEDYKKTFEEEKEKLKEEIKIYKVLDFIESGAMPDGSKPKISKASMLELATEEELKPFKKILTNKEEGIHVGILAESFGYDSGISLYEDLLNHPPIEELADMIASQKMEDAEPDPSLASEEEIESIARRAIHNEKRARLLSLEMDYLIKKYPSYFKDAIRRTVARPPSRKEVKEAAERVIDNRSLKDIKPYKYYLNERRAAKEAGKALAKGDIKEAFNKKKEELFNFELYRAANKAQELEARGKAFFKKLNKKDEVLAKSKDIDFINAARAMLDRYKILSKKIDGTKAIEALKNYDGLKYRFLKALIYYLSVDFDKENFKDLTVEELSNLINAVKGVYTLAGSEKKMEIGGKLIEKEVILSELNEQFDKLKLKEHRMGLNKAPTEFEKNFTVKLMGARAMLRRVESWADGMDLTDPLGPFKKYIFYPIKDAVNLYREKNSEIRTKYKNLLDDYSSNLSFNPINAKEITYKFKDKAELMGALLHIGNDSNKRKLLLGRGWATQLEDGTLVSPEWDSFIDRMQKTGVLKKADYDFIQKIWDMFEDLKPITQRAHKKLYGFYFNEITSNPVETPFGTYKGGYAPAITDSFLVDDQTLREEIEQLETKATGLSLYPQTYKGFSKERIENYTKPLVMDLKLFPMHLDKALRFAYIQPAVSSVASLVNHSDFKDRLNAVDLKATRNLLISWLDRSVKQLKETQSHEDGARVLDDFARSLRTNTGLAIMTGNASNALQQLTGLSIAAVKVPPRKLLKSLVGYIFHPNSTSNEISEKSSFMKERLMTSVMEVNKQIDTIILNPSKWDDFKSFTREHGYFLSSMTQNIVDNITWSAAYDEATSKNYKEKDAVRYADSAVRLTQGSFDPEDISSFEAGSAKFKLMTMFYNYFNMLGNLLTTEFASVMRTTGLRKGMGRALYIYTMGFMIPSVIAEAIVQALSGEGFDEDEDEEYLDDFIKLFFGSQARTATALFPFAGPMINAGINKFNDKWYDDRISTSPAISLIESAVQSPYYIYRAYKEGDGKKKAVRDSLTALSLATGVPFTGAGRPISYLIDVEEGEANPENALDFIRGLMTGKRGK